MRFVQSLVAFCLLFSGAQGYVSPRPPPPCKPQPVKPPAHCTQAGDWFTRLRGLYVWPNDSSGSLSGGPRGGSDVHPSWSGDFDFGVMFSKHFGLELTLLTWRNTLIGTKALSGTHIGTTWLFPPTFTLVWRLLSDTTIQPYLAGGGNYTLFYANSSSISNTHLNLSHSWGPVAEAGIDIFFFNDWFFNFDAKYIWLSTDAYLSGATHGKMHITINPWIFGFGIGRKW